MDWLELKIDTSHAGLDAVTEMLEQQGVTGVMIDDEADFQSFLENNRQYWDYVDDDLLAQKKGVSRVTFYLERNEDAYGTVAAVRMAMSALKKDHPEYAPLLLTMADVADEDWENNWKQYYKPMEIGDRLLVVPEWLREDPKVRAGLAAGRVALVLDPGLTFGTGSHASTQLCLEGVEAHTREGDRVLDLGCGSGILGIGALLLGCAHVTGCDIDPKAPEVAAANAALNGFYEDRFTVCAGDILADAGLRRRLGTGYDIVLANIVADVIIPLAALAPAFLAPGGTFVCSGIIDGREDEVAAALTRAGFTVTVHDTLEEWHCFTSVLA